MSGPAVEAASALPVVRRVLVTLVVVGGALGLARIPNPFVSSHTLSLVTGGGMSTANFGIGALGVSPLLSAWVTVEVVAALVPRWRALRDGGVAGRRKLDAAARIAAVAFALTQGFGVAMSLEGTDAFESAGWSSRLGTSVTLAAFSMFLLALNRLVADHGIGSPMAIWVAAQTVDELATAFVPHGGIPLDVIARVALVVTIMVLASVCVLSALATSHRGAVSAPLWGSGVKPISMAIGVVGLANLLGWVSWLQSGEEPQVVTGSRDLAVVAVASTIAVAFARWFHPVGDLDAVAARITGPTESSDRSARGAVGAMVVASVVAVTLVHVGPRLLLSFVFGGKAALATQAMTNGVSWVILTAIGLDLIAESRFRIRHAQAVVVAREHRVWVASSARRALEASGITVLTRGSGFRTATQIFGPYVPIEIVVPADDAQAARDIVATMRA